MNMDEIIMTDEFSFEASVLLSQIQMKDKTDSFQNLLLEITKEGAQYKRTVRRKTQMAVALGIAYIIAIISILI